MPNAVKNAKSEGVHNFNDSLKSEALLDIALRRTFGDAVHADYRQHAPAQKMGFDYLLRWARDNVVYKIAVDDKADTRMKETGNVSLELFTFSPRRSISTGWLFYSMAFALRYACMDTQEVFFLPFEEVRAYVLPRLAEFATVSAVNTRGEQFSHITFNVLVPIKTLLENCPSARIVLLENATRTFSVGFEDRVITPEVLLSGLEGLAQYSKASPALSNADVQRHLEANRLGRRHADYVTQCRLPRGIELAA